MTDTTPSQGDKHVIDDLLLLITLEYKMNKVLKIDLTYDGRDPQFLNLLRRFTDSVCLMSRRSLAIIIYSRAIMNNVSPFVIQWVAIKLIVDHLSMLDAITCGDANVSLTLLRSLKPGDFSLSSSDFSVNDDSILISTKLNSPNS